MIRIGTCSWAEKTLISSGEFYPQEVRSAEERLRYYASRFDTVEIDSTYYAIPPVRNAFLWAERTPDEFVFHIKAFGGLTGHGVSPEVLPKEILKDMSVSAREKRFIYLRDREVIRHVMSLFLESVSPISEGGKLGLLVFQFPPWFRYGKGQIDHLVFLKELTSPYRVGIEFRHGSWLNRKNRENTLSILRDLEFTYIIADEPWYGTEATVPYLPATTTDTGYFRLHGRNRKNWLRKGIETSLRYDYDYSDEELRGFIPDIQRIGSTTRECYIMFNNCHGASAVKNALRLIELIKDLNNG